MAETPYLVDSNVLLRWVKPNHRDYPLIVSGTEGVEPWVLQQPLASCEITGLEREEFYAAILGKAPKLK
jgi:hypothetical protein